MKDEILRVIKARIEGRFDDPDLTGRGALSVDSDEDILSWIEEAQSERQNKDSVRTVEIRNT